MNHSDAVDDIVAQWNRELPDLTTDAMGTIGRLHRVSRLVVSAHLEEIFRLHGLGRTEFDVAASLYRSGEPYTLSPKQIGSTLMLTSGGLTGRLDKLERSGLIERLPDPDDRRALRVRLTEKGRQAVEGAVRDEVEYLDEVLSPLDDAERRELDRLLRKLHRSDRPSSI
ncbi:MarR family winged helix-turn-helix transcriptional regulator [Haloglycomyces albus]|uniref:MarR family winged helix-turn-helix transcriptional regulator n=1 Tax=Haloglycomyces albus TaxID=526067 RepID=UPI00046D86B3|nr:MarR family transcriptional regulator [Haloglycomyces albus]